MYTYCIKIDIYDRGSMFKHVINMLRRLHPTENVKYNVIYIKKNNYSADFYLLYTFIMNKKMFIMFIALK